MSHPIPKYQAIVVGAGPAGSRAASALSENGVHTLVLEKKPRPGTPVRCAEGIGEKGLAAAGLHIKPEWICTTIQGAIFHSPSGYSVHVDKMDPGYVLNRTIFDYDLAQIACANGAELRLNRTVYHVSKHNHNWRLFVHAAQDKEEYECELLIIADGVESRIARQIGLCACIDLKDLETCAQFLVENVNIDQTKFQFFTGKHIAPGGYGWVFPKGNGRANIGLGILAKSAKPGQPILLLGNLVKTKFPSARIIDRTVGGVPVGLGLENLVDDGVMVVGDAARHVNCVAGGGLSYALTGGRLAGLVGARAIARGDLSKQGLRSYPKQWNKGLGKQQKRSYQIKEALLMLSNQELDKIAFRISQKKSRLAISLVWLFSQVFLRRPALLWKAIRFLS